MGLLEGAAMKSALGAGAIGAAVPLAAQGIYALTPQAREQRKLDAKMRQDALRTLDRGKKHGFGPSKQRRNQQVARRMKDYDTQMSAAKDTLDRQEALMGIGRSGAIQDQRQQMAEQRAGAVGMTRAQVEDEARAIGRQREAQAYANLNQERAVQAQRNQERQQLIGGALQQGVGMGMSAYKHSMEQQNQEAWRQDLLKAMQAQAAE